MIKFSFSKLSTYLDRPCYYNYKYVQGNYESGKNDHFAIGGGFGKFLEEWALHPYYDLTQLKQIYLAAALKNPAADDKKKIQSFTKLVELYYKSGKKIKPWIIPQTGKPAVEVAFNTKFEKYGVWYNGAIDIIAHNRSIVDYKTASSPISQEDVDNHLDGYGLQLSIYALIYYEAYGELPPRVGIQNILKDFSGIQNVASKRTFSQLMEVVDLTKEVERKIKMKEFPYKKSWKCKNCPNLGCPKKGR